MRWSATIPRETISDNLKYIDRISADVSIPKDHPRYKSLMVREHLAEMVEKGMVNPTGLISHGRGEAFDYLMGERTLDASLEAEKAAAAHLLKAKRPMVCVNGNAAALDAKRLIELAETIPAALEINLFHRTEERVEKLIQYMESEGGKNVLGRNPDARLPGLNHDRALCTKTLYDCDVIVVPIEDGDRAEALVKMGKVVISIDINPLSRTSRTATVPVSDEMSRALENIIGFVKELRGKDDEIDSIIKTYSNDDNRREVLHQIAVYLESQ